MIGFNGDYGLLADRYLGMVSRVLCQPSRRLCCSRKCECLRAGYYDCISLPEIASSVLLSQYRTKCPKATSETLGRHRLSGCI
jgi:hypothetical protein